MKKINIELDINKYAVFITRNGHQWLSVLYGETLEDSLLILKAYEQIGFKWDADDKRRFNANAKRLK